jgi:hypothetical protein
MADFNIANNYNNVNLKSKNSTEAIPQKSLLPKIAGGKEGDTLDFKEKTKQQKSLMDKFIEHKFVVIVAAVTITALGVIFHKKIPGLNKLFEKESHELSSSTERTVQEATDTEAIVDLNRPKEIISEGAIAVKKTAEQIADEVGNLFPDLRNAKTFTLLKEYISSGKRGPWNSMRNINDKEKNIGEELAEKFDYVLLDKEFTLYDAAKLAMEKLYSKNVENFKYYEHKNWLNKASQAIESAAKESQTQYSVNNEFFDSPNILFEQIVEKNSSMSGVPESVLKAAKAVLDRDIPKLELTKEEADFVQQAGQVLGSPQRTDYTIYSCLKTSMGKSSDLRHNFFLEITRQLNQRSKDSEGAKKLFNESKGVRDTAMKRGYNELMETVERFQKLLADNHFS